VTGFLETDASAPPVPSPKVVVVPDDKLLAATVAARTITALLDAQAARGVAHVVLTGGTIGIGTLASLATAPGRDAVDWTNVHIWWGDERFVPEDDGDRNQRQAREALLGVLTLDPAKVHAMPPSGGDFDDDVDAAAADYARELVDAAEGDAWAPAFDVLMLGVGPDGHIASLFPGLPGIGVTNEGAIGVTDSPKPPPTRISMTLPVLNGARQVWLIAAGEGKAEAVAKALAPDLEPGELRLPAGQVRGSQATLWLLDRAAASQL
jgi:6-phosphogluconolactonase